MTLDQLTKDVFAEHLGSKFHIQIDDATRFELELTEAVAATRNGSGGRSPRPHPFSVVFRGPKRPILPQRMYKFEHEKLGALEIFVVPIGQDENGIRYEAIFN